MRKAKAPAKVDAAEGEKRVGRPRAPDLEGVQPVRTTIYLAPEQLRRLRIEAHRRLIDGGRADVSQIIREAVDAYLPSKRGR